MVFISEQNYDQLHTDDVIVNTKGWCPTEHIMIKHSKWNIITTLHGTDTLELKEWHNGDDDNGIDINDDGGKAPNENDYHEPQPKILTSQLVILPCLESF
jgi:hypothetical protein